MPDNPQQSESKTSFGGIVATFGAVLIALGVAWLIALNWHDIPSALKILILVLATVAAYAAGVLCRVYQYPRIGSALLVLGALLYTLSIFLIAQIFSTETSMQGFALLLLLAWVGVFIASYLFTSTSSIAIALIEFLVWISVQYIAFVGTYERNFAVGILAIIYLSVGILLYGLTQFHKSRNHPFTETYRYWTALYILLLTYILSFQTFLPSLWPPEFHLAVNVLLFLLVLAALAVIIAIIGIASAVNAGKLSGKEVIGFVALVFLYILLIAAASLVSGQGSYYLFGGGTLTPGLFTFWIFDNILFILVILAVIGYGTRSQSPEMVNLAVAFFALDIITRYIGFIMDYGGYVHLSVIFILGGIILIAGGWGIERWRRRLIERTKQKSEEYAIY